MRERHVVKVARQRVVVGCAQRPQPTVALDVRAHARRQVGRWSAGVPPLDVAPESIVAPSDERRAAPDGGARAATGTRSFALGLRDVAVARGGVSALRHTASGGGGAPA